MTKQINLRFKDLAVSRKRDMVEGPVNIHNNSTLKSVKNMEGNLSIEFEFSCHYEPDIGLIKIEGDLMMAETEETINSAIEGWEKNNKNLPPEIAEKIHNTILSGCIVEAVILAKEVGLPAPMPTPTVSLGKKDVKEGKPIRIEDETKHYIR